MLGLRRNLSSLSRVLQKPQFPRFLSESSEKIESDGGAKKGSFRRRAIPIVLISLTGGVALSAFNDLAIFNGCSRKAIEKANQNVNITEALGEPIVRGPWYNASLAVGYRRNTISCTFPVSGPQGSGIFQLKAVRTGEDSFFSFLRHNDWDILIMEALLHVPTNDDPTKTVRVSLTDITQSLAGPVECKECKSPDSRTLEK